MAPIRKLNENLEALLSERYSNLRKVRRRDHHDSGGSQRQFQELVEEFNTEEQRREPSREGEGDKVDIQGKKPEAQGADQLEILKNKASYKIHKADADDEDIGTKLDTKV
jgi:hypothetical protein